MRPFASCARRPGSSPEVTQLGTLHEGYGFVSQRYHVFVADVAGMTEATPEASEGEMTFAWITPEGFWARVDSGDISDGATLAAMALFTRWRGRVAG